MRSALWIVAAVACSRHEPPPAGAPDEEPTAPADTAPAADDTDEPDDDLDDDGFPAGIDCDDLDPAVNPDATEVCANGADDDCDGQAVECRVAGDLGVVDVASGWWVSEQITAAGDALAVGDLDGDGADDLVVAASEAEVDDGNNVGRVFLTTGEPGESSPLDDHPSLVGDESNVEFGHALATGDVDGDGQIDLLVATHPSVGPPSAYVFRGPRTTSGTALDADAAIFGAEPVATTGGGEVAAVDTDGDGTSEVIFAVPYFGLPAANTGAVYLFRRPDSASPVGDADTTIRGASEGGLLGFDVAGGDLDADGVDELVVSSPSYGSAPDRPEGSVRVFEAPAGAVAAADAMATLTGEEAGDSLGVWVRAGDLDGDGADDLALGAMFRAAGGLDDAGTVYLHHGAASGEVPAGTLPHIDGTAVRRYLGGYDGGLVADLDGDGAEDLVVGSATSQGVEQRTGEAWLWYGPVTSSALDTDADLHLVGLRGDALGQAVAAPDLDGDGAASLAVSARQNLLFSGPGYGRVYVLEMGF